MFKRQPPTPVQDSDEIVPVHVFDDLSGYRKTLLMWTFQFNDVLDADKLHEALCELIEKGENWRKLGGRLRLNVCMSSIRGCIVSDAKSLCK